MGEGIRMNSFAYQRIFTASKCLESLVICILIYKRENTPIHQQTYIQIHVYICIYMLARESPQNNAL